MNRTVWIDWKATVEYYRRAGSPSPPAAPGGGNLSTEQALRPYQEEGVEWLLRRRGGILGDDVGLGKTVQAIAAATATALNGQVLVVTRKSLVPQWAAEIARWDPCGGRDVAVIDTRSPVAGREARWWITHYEALVRRLGELERRSWAVMIADESQAIKNRRAKRTRAVWALARRAERVWLLTATPLRNRPDELWSLLRCLEPDRFRSYWRWVQTYCHVHHNGYGWVIGGLKPEAEARFAREIGPYLLRRERHQVLSDLPPLTEEDVVLEMETAQARAYRQMERDMVAVLERELDLEGLLSGRDVVIAPNVVAQLTRLRQLATCPEVLGGGEGAKTAWLLEALPDLTSDHRLLLFTSFARYAIHLARRLAAARVHAAALVGEMGDAERWQALEALRSGRVRALVMSYGAGGVGLNLQEADLVILLDLPWTPDDVDQAVGRAYRMGQQRPVHVYRLVCEGTVDRHIARVLAHKEEVIGQTIAVLTVLRRLVEQTKAVTTA